MWRSCARYGVMFHDFQHSVYHFGGYRTPTASNCHMLGRARYIDNVFNSHGIFNFKISSHANLRARVDRHVFSRC
jgi:hypothetical protein